MQPPRSYLFVPADRPERYGKALSSGADAVVIDLEDAVQATAKAAARAALASWLEGVDAAVMSRLVVRINDVSTAWYADDLELLRKGAIEQVMLPKAEHAQTIAQLRLQRPGLGVLALIETARGVQNADALATAAGVQRLVFGTIDYALDLDLSGELASTVGLDYAASRLAVASRAAGLAAPVAGVTVAIDDEALLLAEWERARAHGFGAKLCIHPRQIAPIHAALLPSPAEQVWARRVLAAADGAAGAVQLDGRMIDKPVIERARRLLDRAVR